MKPRRVVDERAPIDVAAALAQPLIESSWIVPGPAQLVLGRASVQALDGAPAMQVQIVEEQGNDVRVGVRLDHARFALWMTRSRLLAIVAREQRVAITGARPAMGSDPIEVVLHAGARVQREAREDGRTYVRYIGALDVEGWIPDDALTDRAPATQRKFGRVPSGRKPLMVMHGAVIRAEPKWSGAQLAIVNQGYVVDTIKAIDDAWHEVGYEDSEVRVHGYVSKRDPPGRTQRKAVAETAPPLPPNATVRDGTCLHAGGEAVGFIVGDRPVLVEKTPRAGWYTITIESPWGPLAFDARGSIESELVTCGG